MRCLESGLTVWYGKGSGKYRSIVWRTFIDAGTLSPEGICRVAVIVKIPLTGFTAVGSVRFWQNRKSSRRRTIDVYLIRDSELGLLSPSPLEG